MNLDVDWLYRARARLAWSPLAWLESTELGRNAAGRMQAVGTGLAGSLKTKLWRTSPIEDSSSVLALMILSFLVLAPSS